jgi:hypothetical protein
MKVEPAQKLSTRPQNAAEELFALAVGFRRAAKLCHNLLLRTQSLHIALPALANTALATELALKCLLQLRVRTFPRTHDLYELYSALPQDDQMSLSSAYLQRYSSPEYALIFRTPGVPAPRTYEESTKHNRDVFVKFRYPDKAAARQSAALAMTLDIALTHLLEVQPSLVQYKLETDDPDEQDSKNV